MSGTDPPENSLAWRRAVWAIEQQRLPLPDLQVLWAAAVMEYGAEFGIPIDLRVLGPVPAPGDRSMIVQRPWVHVIPDDPEDLQTVRTVCASVWRRANRLDTDGHDTTAGAGGHVRPPTIRQRGVFIDFDTLDDVNPWPGKARVCLHMLLAALHRRGLTSLHVHDAARVPGEPDRDLITLAVTADTIDVPLPVTPGPPPRPTFLPPSHKVARRRRGTPTGPVAFLQAHADLSVWDPTTGQFLTLPWSTNRNIKRLGDPALTPDGTALTYLIASMPDDALPPGQPPWSSPWENREAWRTLTTSDLTLEPIDLHQLHWSRTPTGPHLCQTIIRLAAPETFATQTSYEDPTSNPPVPATPLNMQVAGGNFAGAAVHWSPTGQFLLMSTRHNDGNRNNFITRLDLTTFETREYHADHYFQLHGTAPISPDETRCLVYRNTYDPRRPNYYALLNLKTGDLTGIDNILNPPANPPTPGRRHHPLGFLTNTGLVTQTNTGRRTHLYYLDLTTQYPHHLIDLPNPQPELDAPIHLAAQIVQNDPSALGGTKV